MNRVTADSVLIVMSHRVRCKHIKCNYLPITGVINQYNYMYDACLNMAREVYTIPVTAKARAHSAPDIPQYCTILIQTSYNHYLHRYDRYYSIAFANVHYVCHWAYMHTYISENHSCSTIRINMYSSWLQSLESPLPWSWKYWSFTSVRYDDPLSYFRLIYWISWKQMTCRVKCRNNNNRVSYQSQLAETSSILHLSVDVN